MVENRLFLFKMSLLCITSVIQEEIRNCTVTIFYRHTGKNQEGMLLPLTEMQVLVLQRFSILRIRLFRSACGNKVYSR